MFSTRYHFETIMIMLGSVVNEDQSLGVTFTTSRADGVSPYHKIVLVLYTDLQRSFSMLAYATVPVK